MATGEDRQESALDLANGCGWVRALDASGKSIKISKADFILNTNKAYEFSIQPGEECLIYGSEYCIVQVDDYNSGGVALYLVSHYEIKMISNVGSSFATTPGVGSLSVYKKEPNGPLFLCNNSDQIRSVGFKRL